MRNALFVSIALIFSSALSQAQNFTPRNFNYLNSQVVGFFNLEAQLNGPLNPSLAQHYMNQMAAYETTALQAAQNIFVVQANGYIGECESKAQEYQARYQLVESYKQGGPETQGQRFLVKLIALAFQGIDQDFYLQINYPPPSQEPRFYNSDRQFNGLIQRYASNKPGMASFYTQNYLRSLATAQSRVLALMELDVPGTSYKDNSRLLKFIQDRKNQYNSAPQSLQARFYSEALNRLLLALNNQPQPPPVYPQPQPPVYPHPQPPMPPPPMPQPHQPLPPAPPQVYPMNQLTIMGTNQYGQQIQLQPDQNVVIYRGQTMILTGRMYFSDGSHTDLPITAQILGGEEYFTLEKAGHVAVKISAHQASGNFRTPVRITGKFNHKDYSYTMTVQVVKTPYNWHITDAQADMIVRKAYQAILWREVDNIAPNFALNSYKSLVLNEKQAGMRKLVNALSTSPEWVAIRSSEPAEKIAKRWYTDLLGRDENDISWDEIQKQAQTIPNGKQWVALEKMIVSPEFVDRFLNP